MPEALRDRRSGAAGRAIWSGTISFGLVTIPVELYSGSRRAGVSLRTLGPDGTPLSRQYVCAGDGQVVSGDEIERGFEVAEGEFVIVTDEELEQIEPQRSREIALERFVPRADVDPAFFVRSYLLAPAGEQTKAYRLLAESMEASDRAAIARFVMRGNAYAVAIFADAGILRAETLRFGDELRSAEDVSLPEPAAADEERVAALAGEIAALAEPELDASELRDEGAERLLALAQRKRERGEDVVEVADAEDDAGEGGADVVDLLAMLKRRLEAEERDAPAAATATGEEVDADALEHASKQELYERAREREIPGRSRMSREELIESLRNAG